MYYINIFVVDTLFVTLLKSPRSILACGQALPQEES